MNSISLRCRNRAVRPSEPEVSRNSCWHLDRTPVVDRRPVCNRGTEPRHASHLAFHESPAQPRTACPCCPAPARDRLVPSTGGRSGLHVLLLALGAAVLPIMRGQLRTRFVVGLRGMQSVRVLRRGQNAAETCLVFTNLDRSEGLIIEW